jgi:sugar phosphate isomerase/epimerase
MIICGRCGGTHFCAGVSVSGTSVGNTFTHPPGPARDKEIALVKRWVDRAAVLGTSHIRVFAGGAAKDQPRAEAVKNCIAALEDGAEYAGQQGVFLGIENHGGIVAEPTGLLEIIKAVKSPWVGVNLDTGNFHGADPYAELATCAPYAVNVQIKSEIRRAGAKENEAADLARVVKILRDANYQGLGRARVRGEGGSVEGGAPAARAAPRVGPCAVASGRAVDSAFRRQIADRVEAPGFQRIG